jgi:hypothetical protein
MKRPRVGILTFHFSENYGALMQAYALRQWLLDHGTDAEFIPYHPRYVERGGDLQRAYDPRMWKANLKILYLRLSSLRRRLFGDAIQARHFSAFAEHMLGLASSSLATVEEVDSYLNTSAGKYDLLVCGSDQIWSPSVQKGFDRAYFLDFAFDATGVRRISYAPSFGRQSLDEGVRAEAREHLNKLDAISVREASGAGIVKELTGRDAAVGPDPTILLGDFSRLISSAEPVPSGHVLCYALCSGKGIRSVAQQVGGRLNREVLSPYNVHRRWREIGRTVHPSPAGWAALIDKAGFVVTNSFHGTVFSVLRHRPFISVALPGPKSRLNERARSLLESIGLSRRFLAFDEIDQATSRMEEPINWEDSDRQLAALRRSGSEFLTDQIGHICP